jgi:hypothetical protein
MAVFVLTAVRTSNPTFKYYLHELKVSMFLNRSLICRIIVISALLSNNLQTQQFNSSKVSDSQAESSRFESRTIYFVSRGFPQSSDGRVGKYFNLSHIRSLPHPLWFIINNRPKISHLTSHIPGN